MPPIEVLPGPAQRVIPDTIRMRPDEVFVAEFDWTGLLGTSATISTSAFEATEPLLADDVTINGLLTGCTLSGAAAGGRYTLKNKITSAGRTYVRHAEVIVP